MRVAALDLGSNTSLLLVADVADGVIERILHDETHVTRMGQGVQASRRFHPDALARMDKCLRDYRATIERLNCYKTVAVATSAARDVENSEELMRLGRTHSIPIHIIPGVKEAELTFRGALCDRIRNAGIAVVDVGGGSTEVIADAEGGPEGVSIDIGSVRLTEKFISRHPVPQGDRRQMEAHVKQAFAKVALPRRRDLQEVVAVAGTPTTLAALDQEREFDEKHVHGCKLSLARIEYWTERLAAMTIEERERLPGMQPERADVIVAGAVVLAGAIQALGHAEVTVSTRGVRYGVALAWQEF
ncbi:MAG: Ppx/GppA family phosphatase [Bdellovibrionales bacterium]